MITDQQFSEWAQSSTKAPILLIEIAHQNGIVYLSDNFYATGIGEDPEHVSYHVCLSQSVLIERTLDQDSLGAIRVYNDGSLDEWLNYSWLYQKIDVFIGDKSWPRSDFRRQYSATVSAFNELSASSFEFKTTKSTSISNSELLVSNFPPLGGNHTDTPAFFVGDIYGAKCWRIGHPSLFNRGDLVITFNGVVKDITWDDTTPLAAKRGTFTVDGYVSNYGDVRFTCSGTMQKFKELFEYICNSAGQAFNAENLADYPVNPDVTFYINQSMTFNEFLELTLETVGAVLWINDNEEIELYQKQIPDEVSINTVISWITPNDNPTIQTITLENPVASVYTINADYNHNSESTPAFNEYNAIDFSAPYRIITAHSYAEDSAAGIEARRLADLLSVTRRTYSVSINRISPEIHIGAIVNIYSPKDRWNNGTEGLNALVVGFTQSYKSNKSELIVWR